MWQHQRPAIAPLHRQQEGFAAQGVMVAAVRAGGQKHRPPAAIGKFHKLRMASGGDRGRARRVEVALGQHRIARPRLVGAGDLAAAVDHLRVLFAGAAFGRGEVVVAIAPEQMRAFDVLGIAGRLEAGIHDHLARADQLHARQIQLLQPDGAVAVVAQRAGRHIVVDQPGAAVVVEEQRRVDALGVQPDRIRPRPGRVLGGDQEIAPVAVETGVGDVERAVMVADAGGEQAAGERVVAVVDLAGAIDGVADLDPVHQIAALEHRQAREIPEAGSDQIKRVADADRRWVWIEAGQHWIAVLRVSGHRATVIALVVHLGDQRRAGHCHLAGHG